MSRKSKTDWFRAGLNLLALHGPSGLKLEALIQEVGVTKGSFYHHFGSLADYRTALLEYLEQVGYADVVRHVDPALGAAEQLRQLTQIVSHYDHAEDRILRAWAERDPEAKALVRRMDERRMAYLQERFAEVLGDPARAAFITRLVYAFFLGAGQIEPPLRGEEYLQMVTTLENAFFTQEEPHEQDTQ